MQWNGISLFATDDGFEPKRDCAIESIIKWKIDVSIRFFLLWNRHNCEKAARNINWMPFMWLYEVCDVFWMYFTKLKCTNAKKIAVFILTCISCVEFHHHCHRCHRKIFMTCLFIICCYCSSWMWVMRIHKNNYNHSDSLNKTAIAPSFIWRVSCSSKSFIFLIINYMTIFLHFDFISFQCLFLW